ncbi:MAG: hypothetical protein A2408_01680 [Candidatus Yonathbacteria bacterium RIFOXYC1_FULL_52_10]|uniref:Uncharacterized protein n=1 Tax=Candidatus Yonathbacteria bacterium RIFOXYD1_FULL_52_36 TaxID=1802730 RepID=A0A1G2SJ07_9BACT|nr:MAG: hypothetical protein A2591_03370 [Candidatus Yonathbacteria bacterium RIFOXYD1_FULL_52_36]OHA84818.1 MAG: hypothetical protein A2408_01680 [Candidatus Yonathbacteria bacterium RIFOXYC1_FULL_52_10]
MTNFASGEKFLEILARNGISTDLDTMAVAMHRERRPGINRVTFYGVGAPIPEDIMRAIRREVFPLLKNEGTCNRQVEVRTPLKPVPCGEPKKRQDEWDRYCANFNLACG